MHDGQTLTILLFASLRDVVGEHEIKIDYSEGMTVLHLKEKIISCYPQLHRGSKNLIISINRNFALDSDLVPFGSEIALFPPVSGGGASLSIIEIIETPIIIEVWLEKIKTNKTGALNIFVGVVRGESDNAIMPRTEALEYQVYLPMAKAMLEKIVSEIRKTWPKIEGIVIIQRIGKLVQGTPSVLIACSASHRNDGIFEATRFAIDRLKEIVPIWKKEIGTNGETWIEGDFIPGKEVSH